MVKNRNKIYLLWTGGWDSTFRLAYLLTVKKETVQPIYIIDEGRDSKEIEQKVMGEIRKLFFEKFPETEKLLLNTEIHYKKDIKASSVIEQMYNNLAKDNHIGKQYNWLARFAEQYDFKNLEIGIQKDGNIDRLLKGNLIEKKDGKDIFYILKEKPENDNLKIFARFRFPILYYSKTDMLGLAGKYKFLSIMKKTWFCHHPTKKDLPCGWCAPCRIAKKEGMGRRVPFSIKGFLKGTILEIEKKIRDLR